MPLRPQRLRQIQQLQWTPGASSVSAASVVDSPRCLSGLCFTQATTSSAGASSAITSSETSPVSLRYRRGVMPRRGSIEAPVVQAQRSVPRSRRHGCGLLSSTVWFPPSFRCGMSVLELVLRKLLAASATSKLFAALCLVCDIPSASSVLESSILSGSIFGVLGTLAQVLLKAGVHLHLRVLGSCTSTDASSSAEDSSASHHFWGACRALRRLRQPPATGGVIFFNVWARLELPARPQRGSRFLGESTKRSQRLRRSCSSA